MSDKLPAWNGVNHLAMVTSDMDATVRFYHGVLGMPLVHTLAAGPMRHYFFRIGGGTTLAFFEWDGTSVGRIEKPAGLPPSFPAQFDHISFDLPDEAALHDLQDRLRAAGVEITDVVDHGFVHSVYFSDPNGIALEASWWVIDPTDERSGLGDERLSADPHPVAAVEEILATGTVSTSPRTRLAMREVVDPA